MSQPKTLTLTNDLSELPRLAQFLEIFAQEQRIDDRSIMKLNLALDELVTNIISYAYPDGQMHSFNLLIQRCGDQIEAELSDDGIPFNPLKIIEPDTQADIESRQVGGLGIHFVRQTMDEVYYRFEQGQNQLRLVKRLTVKNV